jgi:hypothetical protein
MCNSCKTAEAAAQHRKSSREWAAKKRSANKSACILKYGGSCVCCGETEPIFLCIDHIEDDGARHRELIGQGIRKIGSGSIIYAWLVKNNFPAGFQLMCANCNLGKQSGGCPHQS